MQDKQINPLLCLAMHGLEQSAVKVSSVSDEDNREFAENAQSLLKLQSRHISLLHSDVVRRRKTATFKALGMIEKEASQLLQQP